MNLPATRILLLVSLGGNLFLAGWIFGGFWLRPPMLPPSMVQRLEARISPEGFAQVESSLKEIDIMMQGGLDEMRDSMEAVREAASEDAFDAEKVRVLLNALPLRRQENDSKFNSMILAILAKLSAKDRALASDVLFRRPPPPPPPPPR